MMKVRTKRVAMGRKEGMAQRNVKGSGRTLMTNSVWKVQDGVGVGSMVK